MKHRPKKYLAFRLECPLVSQCGGTFITKSGFLAHIKRRHAFTSEELEFPRRFLKEKP